MNDKAIYILKEAPVGSEIRCQQAFLLLRLSTSGLKTPI